MLHLGRRSSLTRHEIAFNSIDGLNVFIEYSGSKDLTLVLSRFKNHIIDVKRVNIIELLRSLGIIDIKCLSFFGSLVYGTDNIDSDVDLICITNDRSNCGEQYISDDINIKFYSVDEFQFQLDEQEISAIETYCLKDVDSSYYLVGGMDNFKYELNKGKLRASISQLCSHSWQKGKQKLVKVGDYNLTVGLKSIFHSIRIYGLAIDICLHGTITDYSKHNYIYKDLLVMAMFDSYNKLWEGIQSKYLSEYKKLRSQFKQLAPKQDMDSFKETEAVRNLLKEYGISLGSKETQFIKRLKGIL